MSELGTELSGSLPVMNELAEKIRQLIIDRPRSRLPHIQPVVGTSLQLTPAIKVAVHPKSAEVIAQEPVAKQADQDVVRCKSGFRNSINLRYYVLFIAILTGLSLATVAKGNQTYSSEMYGEQGMVPAAQAAAQGLNYAVFDLNINIRELRAEYASRMLETPDVILLGASHWQEAHAGLVQNLQLYNSHVHRDYWEDPLGVVEMFEAKGRLPKRVIIAIRDKQFTPLDARKDYLWEPGIAYYQQMAARLGLKTEAYWKTLPYQRIRSLLSISMLFDTYVRWNKASERPHATTESNFKTLDVLRPDGSILWSQDHHDLFTTERRQKETKNFLKASLNSPPIIDPKGVEAFEALLSHLRNKGVEVYLVNPPFNPEFYDHVKDSPYAAGLAKVEQLTEELAKKYSLKTFGSFDPHHMGCVADDYIDAEHANPHCLGKVFAKFNAIVKSETAVQ